MSAARRGRRWCPRCAGVRERRRRSRRCSTSSCGRRTAPEYPDAFNNARQFLRARGACRPGRAGGCSGRQGLGRGARRLVLVRDLAAAGAASTSAAPRARDGHAPAAPTECGCSRARRAGDVAPEKPVCRSSRTHRAAAARRRRQIERSLHDGARRGSSARDARGHRGPHHPDADRPDAGRRRPERAAESPRSAELARGIRPAARRALGAPDARCAPRRGRRATSSTAAAAPRLAPTAAPRAGRRGRYAQASRRPHRQRAETRRRGRRRWAGGADGRNGSGLRG